MRKTYKYCLFPTDVQAQALDAQLGEACRLYNGALQERRNVVVVNTSVPNEAASFRERCDTRSQG